MTHRLPAPDDPTLQGATEVAVGDGRIVGVHSTCIAPPDELVEQHKLGEPLWAP